MAEKKGKSHKEIRKEYTFNKLKGLGKDIIEDIKDDESRRLNYGNLL